MENPYYFTHNHLPEADKQEVTAVYSVLGEREGHSVEQSEYSVLKKPKKQHLSSEETPQPTNGAHSPLLSTTESPPPIPPKAAVL